ncbi:MAG: hypothetical protein IPG67_17010 [Acidobacteria bacterium]|nr:hypothetical protein [Acidobacteriota bacterium]
MKSKTFCHTFIKRRRGSTSRLDLDEKSVLGTDEVQILKDICGDDNILYQLTRELIDVENRFRTANKRAGLYSAIEKAFRRNFYNDIEDARSRAQRRKVVSNLSELRGTNFSQVENDTNQSVFDQYEGIDIDGLIEQVGREG